MWAFYLRKTYFPRNNLSKSLPPTYNASPCLCCWLAPSLQTHFRMRGSSLSEHANVSLGGTLCLAQGRHCGVGGWGWTLFSEEPENAFPQRVMAPRVSADTCHWRESGPKSPGPLLTVSCCLETLWFSLFGAACGRATLLWSPSEPPLPPCACPPAPHAPLPHLLAACTHPNSETHKNSKRQKYLNAFEYPVSMETEIKVN